MVFRFALASLILGIIPLSPLQLKDTRWCSPDLISRYTQFQLPDIPAFRKLPGRDLSIEEMNAACAPGPCAESRPFTIEEFAAYVAREARILRAEWSEEKAFGPEVWIRTVSIKGQNQTVYYSQIVRNNKPLSEGQTCGVWRTEPKPKGQLK